MRKFTKTSNYSDIPKRIPNMKNNQTLIIYMIPIGKNHTYYTEIFDRLK